MGDGENLTIRPTLTFSRFLRDRLQEKERERGRETRVDVCQLSEAERSEWGRSVSLHPSSLPPPQLSSVDISGAIDLTRSPHEPAPIPPHPILLLFLPTKSPNLQPPIATTPPPPQGASVAGASCQATPATSLRRFKVGYSNGAAAQLKPGGGGLLPSDGVGGGRGGLVSNGPKQISLTDACSVSERSMQCNSMHCSTAC